MEGHQDGPGCLKLLGKIKTKVADAQGQCSLVETADTGWIITREIAESGDIWRRERIWAMFDPDSDSLQSGWGIGLCEGPGAC